MLEIGPGTGYNAALLAYLVGDPHLVTTIDVGKAMPPMIGLLLRRGGSGEGVGGDPCGRPRSLG